MWGKVARERIAGGGFFLSFMICKMLKTLLGRYQNHFFLQENVFEPILNHVSISTLHT